MEAIIIRLTPYKEKDYIVNAFTGEGQVTFSASGALNVKSQFAGKLFLYALVDIELKETKAGFSLVSIKNLNYIAKIFTDYQKIITLNLIGEIMIRTLKDDDSISEAFPLLKNTLLGLPNTSKLLSLSYLFITNLLKVIGLGFVIDRCVNCGVKDDIVGVSFYDGGLICKNCRNTDTMVLNEQQIKIIRYGFMINETQLFRHEFADEELKDILKRFIVYLEETYNFKIVSSELIY